MVEGDRVNLWQKAYPPDGYCRNNPAPESANAPSESFDVRPRILQDVDYMGLIALKSSAIAGNLPHIVHRVDIELRQRHNEYVDFLDAYDKLSPELQEAFYTCYMFRMHLGAVNRHV